MTRIAQTPARARRESVNGRMRLRRRLDDGRCYRVDQARYELTIGQQMIQCPYYRGQGICASGCWEEPVCITGEPSGGWLA